MAASFSKKRKMLFGGSSDIKSQIKSGMKDNDAFIYYDASITNTSDVDLKEAKFASQGNELVLESGSEYAASIIRFEIPTDEIPLVQSLSFSGANAIITTGSPNITNITPTGYEELQVGFLIYSGNTAPLTFVTAFSKNQDGTVNITMNKNAIGTDTNAFLVASGYYMLMENPYNPVAANQVVSVPVSISGEGQTYQNYVSAINFSLQSCFADLKQVNPGVEVPSILNTIVTVDSPFIVLQDNKFSMYGEKYYWTNENSPVGGVNLYFNENLYRLFRGIPATKLSAIGGSSLTPGSIYNIKIEDYSGYHDVPTLPTISPSGSPILITTTNGSPNITGVPIPSWVGQNVTGTNIPPFTTIIGYVSFPDEVILSNPATASGETYINIFSSPYTAAFVTQNSTSLTLWSPVQRIIFTTSMPVSTQVTRDLNLFIESSNNANPYRPILIDFEPIYGTDDFTPYQYFPQGPWKFVDLIGSTDVRQVDIQVYWIDKIGRYNLIQIPPNDKCTILLAFVKKEFIQY